MLKKPTKKQLLLRRVIFSTIATLSVLIIATFAILFMLGYRLDSGNGRLEQGALMQFDSSPNGADVFIDNRNIGSRTATKQTVVAGTHTVRMAKAGYQDWSRTLSINAGTLTWLDYTRLVPNDRPVKTVTTYETLTNLVISPDSKWALAQEKTDTPSFHLIDLRAEDIKSTLLELPQSSFSEAGTPDVTHSFSIASWDNGGRYALVKHLYKDQTEWIVADTQNIAQTVNVTQLLGVGFSDLKFTGTSGKTFYGLTSEGAIRKVDLAAATISRTFVTHVESFSLFDNTIISYVGLDPSDATKRVAGVYRDGDESAHVLRTIDAADGTLLVSFGRYFSDNYVAIAEGNKVSILKGSFPSSSSQDATSLAPLTSFDLSGAATALSFSPGSNYVLAQSGAGFKSYEIEHKRTEIGMLPTTNGAAASTLKWLDGSHLWTDDADTLVMRDFNGINPFSIMTVVPGFDASLSQNGRFFYAVGKSDKGFHLQRVTMILQ